MSNLEVNNLFSVEGMVFVLTGGGSGIGAMFAKALDINGAAKVYILGRRVEKLQEVASSAKNKSIVPIQCDITSKDALAAAAAQIQREVGFVNTVIANSGATGPDMYGLPKDRRPTLPEIQKYLWDFPMADFNSAFEVNTTACFYTLVAFLELLNKGNESEPGKRLGVKSQFVVTGSIAAFSRRPGMGFAYAGSKIAAIHIAKQLATMMADWRVHIRVNVFCPGVYPSDMSKGLMGAQDMSQEGSVAPEMVPLTRAGMEEDAGGALLFMVSRAGAYTNGNILISDGGRMSIVPATY
ncbi:NAD(P)-binding protein [Amniculicola lignicola CBS 123094]|uniref:NAD(P)-binding protein n=1 Tax=Amniculicola lignicola CBS 123094 TaxID=1392246 RepID=A0A6A5X527_9PLEO|nr:NAD(P)-binding protein [Amniculicola lignicola CBS 123094]